MTLAERMAIAAGNLTTGNHDGHTAERCRAETTTAAAILRRNVDDAPDSDAQSSAIAERDAFIVSPFARRALAGTLPAKVTR